MTDTNSTDQNDQIEKIEDQDLLTGVLGTLYRKLTMGNDDRIRSNQQFFAWLPTGYAVTPESMRFMKTLMGESASDAKTMQEASEVVHAAEKVRLAKEQARAEAVANGQDVPDGEDVITPDVQAAQSEADKVYQRNRDTAERLEQAAQFSEILNQVPAVPEFDTDKPQAMVLYQSQTDVRHVFNSVLRMCETASYKLSDDDKKKIARLRNLFVEKYEETDLITEEKVTKYRQSRLYEQYQTHMMAYETAMMEYQNLRTEAMAGTIPGATMRFATQGPVLENRVKFAHNAWVMNGRKNDVDRVAAYLESAGLRDAGLIKSELFARQRSIQIASPMTGTFLPTLLAPSSFLDEGAGWMKFTFDSRESSNSWDHKSRKTRVKAGGGARFGFFRAKQDVDVASAKQSRHAEFQTEGFSFSCEYTMTSIFRPWFDRAFFQSNMIRLPSGMEPICDGQTPPSGQMTCLPTQVVLIRNLKMNIHFAKGERDRFAKSLNVDSGTKVSYAGIGGLSVDVSHNNQSGGGSNGFESQSQSLSSDGMQIIGFMCDILPECPVPLDDPNITWGAPDLAMDPVKDPAEAA